MQENCPVCYTSFVESEGVRCIQCKQNICSECFTKIHKSRVIKKCCPLCRAPSSKPDNWSISDLEPSDPEFTLIASFTASARLILSISFIYRFVRNLER